MQAETGSQAEILAELKQVSFGYGSRRILDNMSIRIPRGKVTTILGPSGTGKTTILRMMTGQWQPQSGEVVVDGKCIQHLKQSGLYALRQRFGMMFQTGALFNDLTVFENVAFPLRAHTQLPESMIYDLVLMKLEAVGLRGARTLMPAELSGGMARRVALARAIALDPMMILYDEPFTGQDPITVGVIMQLIRKLNDTLGLTSVLVSHDVHEVLTISDHLYLVADGKVVAQGAPDELRNHESEWVQQFLNGRPDGPAPFHYPAVSFENDLHMEVG